MKKGLNVSGMVAATIGVLGFPAHCFAAQWVLNVTPTEVIVGKATEKFVQILVSGTVVNPGYCSAPDSYMISDKDLLGDVLAINLTAIASGREIKIYVTDLCDNETHRPLISAIGLM